MSGTTGHHIREWRAHRGATQGQVADAIGFERSYYSRIENGKRGYDQEILEKLATYYGCTPAALIARAPQDNEELWEIIGRLGRADIERLTEIARSLLEVSSRKG